MLPPCCHSAMPREIPSMYCVSVRRATLDRTGNIHHEDDYRPGSIQEPKHPAPNGAPPGRHQSPPFASSRSAGRPSRSAITENMADADSPRPKPPGVGDGVLPLTSSGTCQTGISSHRTNSGQPSDKLRASIEQEPNRLRTRAEKWEHRDHFIALRHHFHCVIF
jgi:hypothetical protein